MIKYFYGTLSFFVIAAFHLLCSIAHAQTAPCDMVDIVYNPNMPVIWSPDSSQFLVNKKDTAGIYQIYVGNAGDTATTCISMIGPFAILRPWAIRHKMQVNWHPSGNWIICAVEKEYYNELILNGTPEGQQLLEGWLQSGLWMDMYAVTPTGSDWYGLAYTIHGYTGPAFTPDGTKAAWAEALDSSNLAVDVFGTWKLRLSEFAVNNGIPLFDTTADITPAGARWIEPGNFAHDGVRLLVSSDIGIANAEGQDQYIININTGQVTNLNNTPMVWDEHGIFSPDANKILFMTSYPYQSDTNSYHTLSIKAEFMLMDTLGGSLQQLTHFRDTGYYELSQGIAATGFWSPDGSIIYAQSLVFPNYDNWIIHFEGNCGNMSTAIEEEEESVFSIYPNPAGDVVNIVSTELEPGDYEVELRDITGRLICSTTCNYSGAFDISIPLEHVEAGIYILMLQNGKDLFTKRLIHK